MKYPAKLVVLNGPPSCGKDTLADHIAEILEAEHIKFAEALKIMTHRLYDIDFPDDIKQFENCKDQPNAYFYGLTPRQAYIAVSETYIKPTHGLQFFGDRLVDSIRADSYYGFKNFVSSDGGLNEELIPVVQALGAENILVVKIERPGCSFINPDDSTKSDSRRYYPDEFLSKLGIDTKFLPNNGTLEDFLTAGYKLLRDFYDDVHRRAV